MGDLLLAVDGGSPDEPGNAPPREAAWTILFSSHPDTPTRAQALNQHTPLATDRHTAPTTKLAPRPPKQCAAPFVTTQWHPGPARSSAQCGLSMLLSGFTPERSIRSATTCKTPQVFCE